MNRIRDIRELHSSTCWLPLLTLKETWEWNRAQRQCEDEDTRFDNELKFVARIPLAPKTTGFWLRRTTLICAPLITLVVFFEKRARSNLGNLDQPIDGKVVRGCFFGVIRFNVNPEQHVACYLYMVPGVETTISLWRIFVQLEMVADGHSRDLRNGLELLGLLGKHQRSRSPSVFRRCFPLFLVRACALELLGPQKDHYKAIQDAFDRAEILTTPEGLECIIHTCTELLQEQSSTTLDREKMALSNVLQRMGEGDTAVS